MVTVAVVGADSGPPVVDKTKTLTVYVPDANPVNTGKTEVVVAAEIVADAVEISTV
jgi:hypothetical protein